MFAGLEHAIDNITLFAHHQQITGFKKNLRKLIPKKQELVVVAVPEQVVA